MEKLALEIFRSQWLLHTDSVQEYSAMAADYLAGKSVSTGLFSSIPIPNVPVNVALITAAGVMTKADVCDSAGSLTLANQVNTAANDRSIEAIIILSESGPGGQVDGTQILGDAIFKARSKKPVYGAISGMACSAHYWMISQCTKVFATSNTDQIGCIGVMATMRRNKEAASSFEVIYSDLSPDKNAESRDNDVLKEQYLNPVATLFHDTVKRGRGDSLKLEKENVLSGKTYISGAAEQNGLIDGIKPIPQIISAALAESKKQKTQMSQNNTSHLRFQSVLKAARTTALGVTDAGFALNETQMQLIDEQLEASATLSTDLTAAKADVTRLTAELATANQTASNTAADLVTANARIQELEDMDAPTKEAIKKDKDKLIDPKEDPMAKYRTSYDTELIEDMY